MAVGVRGDQDDREDMVVEVANCGGSMPGGGVDLEELRREIPALGRVIYMNTGSSGPSPRAAQEAEAAASRRINDDGPALPESLIYMEQILARARQRLASCLGGAGSGSSVAGADAEVDAGTVSEAEIALTQSTSHGISIVASGLRWQPGDQVIVSRLEHISGLLPWFHYRRLYGIELVWVPEAGSTLNPRAVAAAITPRTKLISISHVSYATGARLPVEEIAEIAARRGVDVLVDGAQAVGAIPVDVKKLGVQYYAVPGQKWLLGPDGTGGLYVSKEATEKLAPAQVGWASVEEHDLEGEYTFKAGAGRFEVAMVPVAAKAALAAAIDWLTGLGWEWIFQRVRSLATHFKQELRRLPGVRLYTPIAEEASAGLVTFAIEGVEPEKAVNWLLRERKILVRSLPYPRALRASLHFFNTEEEIEALLRALRELPR